uniref:Ankyrin repeat and sterile alpha motif domain containing 4B n=1 Tax=Sphenodon punctatus TaxID=8508 RepID=A0A8D0GHN8_SPHPU
MSTRYHQAAADGNLELLKEATRKDLNVADEDGMTPTLLAAYHGHLEAVEIICRRGGDPDKCDIWGNTPLHHAASNGCVHCVSFLINFGANVFALDNDMRSPLDAAAGRDRHECVRILDKAATEQNIKDPKRVTKLKAQAQRNVERQTKVCEKRQEKHQNAMTRNYNKGSVNSARGTASRTKVTNFFLPSKLGTFPRNLKDTFRLKAKKKNENADDQEAGSNGQDEDIRTGRTTVMDVFNEKDEDELANDFSGKSSISEDNSQLEQLSIFKRPGLGNIVFRRNLATGINAEEMPPGKEGIGFGMPNDLFPLEEEETGWELDANNYPDAPWTEEEIGWDDEVQTTPLEVFLVSQNLTEFLPIFMREKIDLEALMLCSDEDLQSIQMQLGPRKKILSATDNRKKALAKPGKTGDTRL